MASGKDYYYNRVYDPGYEQEVFPLVKKKTWDAEQYIDMDDREICEILADANLIETMEGWWEAGGHFTETEFVRASGDEAEQTLIRMGFEKNLDLPYMTDDD